jgi:hypothetical protein
VCDAGEEECGNCHAYMEAEDGYVGYGGVVVDGEVSYGVYMYVGVDGRVVIGDRRGEPWRWVRLWED